MEFGLVCISEILKEKTKTSFQSLTRKRFLELEENGIKVLQQRCLHNLHQTIKILEHCATINIHHYRISSSLFPLLTDVSLNLSLEDFDNYEDIKQSLKNIGEVAKKHDISLSIHPDQFVVLGSINTKAVQNSINELNFTSKILDMMNLPQDYNVPINIHPSCMPKKDDEKTKQEIVDRFYLNMTKCDIGVQKRLVVENQDKGGWNCSDLFMYFYNYSLSKYNHGFPLTYDNLHDSVQPSVFNDKTVSMMENIEAFEQTWDKQYTPVFHWSWGREDNIRAHADYAPEIPPFYHRNINWQIELKKKDYSILELKKILSLKAQTNDPQKIEKQQKIPTIFNREIKHGYNKLYDPNRT